MISLLGGMDRSTVRNLLKVKEQVTSRKSFRYYWYRVVFDTKSDTRDLPSLLYIEVIFEKRMIGDPCLQITSKKKQRHLLLYYTSYLNYYHWYFLHTSTSSITTIVIPVTSHHCYCRNHFLLRSPLVLNW